MTARSIFYSVAALFLLVATYSLGAHRVDAQVSVQFVGISVDPQNGATTAITSSGDVYARGDNPYCNGQQMRGVAVRGRVAGSTWAT